MAIERRPWPARVLHCLDCLVEAGNEHYGGRGLCAVCYKFHKADGTLKDYRIKRTADKTNPCKALVRTIGVTATARLTGHDISDLRIWALKGLPADRNVEFAQFLRRAKNPSEEDRELIFSAPTTCSEP